MKRLHDRDSRASASVVNRRRERGEEVMYMNDVGLEISDAVCNQLPSGKRIWSQQSGLDFLRGGVDAIVIYFEQVDREASAAQE